MLKSKFFRYSPTKESKLQFDNYSLICFHKVFVSSKADRV